MPDCASFGPMNPRNALLIAAFLGVIGVALGAFGAHALKARLAEFGTVGRWETAVHYHLIHSVAIFVAGVWLRVGAGASRSAVGWAVRSWFAGIVLFSGSLYLLALKAPTWLGASAAPLGGLAFVAGWAWIAVAALAKPDKPVE